MASRWSMYSASRRTSVIATHGHADIGPRLGSLQKLVYNLIVWHDSVHTDTCVLSEFARLPLILDCAILGLLQHKYAIAQWASCSLSLYRVTYTRLDLGDCGLKWRQYNARSSLLHNG